MNRIPAAVRTMAAVLDACRTRRIRAGDRVTVARGHPELAEPAAVAHLERELGWYGVRLELVTGAVEEFRVNERNAQDSEEGSVEHCVRCGGELPAGWTPRMPENGTSFNAATPRPGVPCACDGGNPFGRPPRLADGPPAGYKPLAVQRTITAGTIPDLRMMVAEGRLIPLPHQTQVSVENGAPNPFKAIPFEEILLATPRVLDALERVFAVQGVFWEREEGSRT